MEPKLDAGPASTGQGHHRAEAADTTAAARQDVPIYRRRRRASKVPPASGVSPFDLPLSRLSVAGQSAHSQRPVEFFASHDHIIRTILSYVVPPALSSCLQVSRQFHDIASETIYRSVRLFEDDAGDGRPLDKVLLGWDSGVFTQLQASESSAAKTSDSKAKLPNFKARQLGYVRHLTLGVHSSELCATLPAAGKLFNCLETLTIIPPPHEVADSAPMMCKTANYRDDTWAHRRRPCPFTTALNPRGVVFRNLGFSGLPVPYEAGWNPAKLEEVVYYFPLDRRSWDPDGDITRSPLVDDIRAPVPGKELAVKIVFAADSLSAGMPEGSEDLDRFLATERDEFGVENAVYALPPGTSMDWGESMEADEVVDHLRAIVSGILPRCRALEVIGMEWLPIEGEDGFERCIDDKLWTKIRTAIIQDLEEGTQQKLTFRALGDYVIEAPEWEMTEQEKIMFDTMLEAEREVAMAAEEQWGSDMGDDIDNDDYDLYGGYEDFDADDEYFDYANEFGYSGGDDDDDGFDYDE